MKSRRKRKLKRRLPVSFESDVEKAGDGWSLLRAGGREATSLEIPTVQTICSTPVGPVRLALGESGEARVLLPLADDETLERLVDTPALRITSSTFKSAGRTVRFLDLTCLSKDLESVFEDVANEIMERIAAGENCVGATYSTVEDFRLLLERALSSKVPTSMIAGFVGELIVLDRLLGRSSRAWHCWRGPAGDRHDFRNGDFSVEVKVTLHAGNSLVAINSFDQLEPPSEGILHLIHLVLEPVAGGMFNVSALGTSILAKADDPEKVTELFAGVGCSDVEADSWNRLSFRLEDETLYEVTEGFPRLVPSMLPDETVLADVSEVSYKVDLAGAQNFAKDLPSQYTEIEEALTKCL